MLRKAIFPLGGLGTRLYPLTVETSKAVIRFLNRPLIEFSIVKLARQGITEFYMGVSGYFNYKEVYDYFGEGLKIRMKYGLPDVRIRYQPNEDSVGNADSVRIIMCYYDIREEVLVAQADLLFDINLSDCHEYHLKKGAFMTMAVKFLDREEDIRHFGVADLDSDWRIKRFVEKPKHVSEAPSRYVNTGIYMLSKGFRDFIESPKVLEYRERGMMDFGQHIIPLAIELNKSVYAYELKGYWFDVGTPERYLEAVFYLLKNLSPEDLEAKPLTKSVKVQGKSRESMELHKHILAQISSEEIKVDGENLIGRHVKIGKNVMLSNAVIDNYTVIDSNTTIYYSVIMDRCKIGMNTVIRNSIVGRHTRIGRGATIENSVIGDNVVVSDGAKLVNVKVWPHREVPADSHIENMVLR
jgi:mannose-1-phosphate guanylyltransferase